MPAEVLWLWDHYVQQTDKDIWNSYQRAVQSGQLLQWVDRFVERTQQIRQTALGKEVVGRRCVVVMDDKMERILAIKIWVPVYKYKGGDG